MKMKRTLGIGLVSAMALFTGIAANAADVFGNGSLKDTTMPPPAAPCCVITWHGFYVGSNIGAAWPDIDWRFNELDVWRDDDAELIGGLHLGYNWQGAGSLVVGFETDVNFSDTFDYLASVRGRLGVAFDRTLFYTTAGVAFAGLNDDLHFANGFFLDDDSNTGWVAGLGIETKVSPAVSVGLEGLYYSFDDWRFRDNGNIHDVSTDMWTVRGRLTWHFNRDTRY